MKQIKLTEEGFDYGPACYVLKEEEVFDDKKAKYYNQIRLESSVFRPGSYLTISKAQARNIAKFLLEFAGKEVVIKKGGKKK